MIVELDNDDKTHGGCYIPNALDTTVRKTASRYSFGQIMFSNSQILYQPVCNSFLLFLCDVPAHVSMNAKNEEAVL